MVGPKEVERVVAVMEEEVVAVVVEVKEKTVEVVVVVVKVARAGVEEENLEAMEGNPRVKGVAH